jgi:hypothetical protein
MNVVEATTPLDIGWVIGAGPPPFSVERQVPRTALRKFPTALAAHFSPFLGGD